jgi:hypothetical protein
VLCSLAARKALESVESATASAYDAWTPDGSTEPQRALYAAAVTARASAEAFWRLAHAEDMAHMRECDQADLRESDRIVAAHEKARRGVKRAICNVLGRKVTS